MGKKARAGRLDFRGELVDVVLLLALAIACLFTLPCLALPCLPCHALAFFILSLLFFFINSPGGRMEGWPNSFHVFFFFFFFATVNLLFGAPPNIRDSVCFAAWLSVSRKKKPLLPALRSGIEQYSLLAPCFPAPPDWRGGEKCRFSLDSRGEGLRCLCACVRVVAPHRWERSRLGACHASLFPPSLPSATTEIRCCEEMWPPPPHQASEFVLHGILMPPGGVCLRSPVPLPAAAAAAGDDVSRRPLAHACIRSDMTYDRTDEKMQLPLT